MCRLFAFFALLSTLCGSTWANEARTGKIDFFESKIRPVLVQHCYRCHSKESGKSKGGLLLDSQAGWQIGGDSGAAIVPGKPNESLLVDAISRSGVTAEMPPKSHLSVKVVSDFEKWIADGAIDPRDDDVVDHARETIDIATGREFWSFQPRRTFSSGQSIDGFVGPQAPAAPANKLVRRLYLDLIGLPPTADECQEFIRLYNVQSPNVAVATFADRLLARHEFGEKWARHWLDVARYADSNGGDFNLTFHEAWRYRNYVIDAFNSDLPYDQFLREQIAGDLMPADTPEQSDRQLIATGFLMVSPKMLTERDKAKMHLDIADEQIDTIGRSIMGLTIGCARCHDHKFDPIPTADYYAMAGILHSTRTADRVLMDNVNVTGWTNTDLAVDTKTQTLVAAHLSKTKSLQQEIDALKKKVELSKAATETESLSIVVDDIDAVKTGPWRKSTHRTNHVGDHYLATDKTNGPHSIKWKATLPKPGKYELRVSFGGGSGLTKKAPYLVRHAEGETPLKVNQTVQPNINGLWFAIGQFTFGATAEVELTDENADGYVIADAIQLVHVDDLAKESEQAKDTPALKLKELQKQLKALHGKAPKVPSAMAAQDVVGERFGDMHIRIRGEAKNLGRKIPRGFLQVASHSDSVAATIANGESGRLQLADWITHPDHPLTARVMANRIWQQLFGQGIVATSDNFGTRGALPSHPELLDYLAENFVANDWSIKSVVREIVLTKTYQQAAQTAGENDPDNLLLKHQNRRPQPAETIRDSILAIAGELDRKPRESEVKQLGMYAIQTSGKRDASLGQTGKLRQRSIYMPIVRGAEPPSLAVFDLPNPDMVTGKRAVTTVPAQALFMMNSPFVRDMAKAVSVQVTANERSVNEIVGRLYQRILVRKPSRSDIAMAKEYIETQARDGKSRQDAIASFAQILFASTEFRFIE